MLPMIFLYLSLFFLLKIKADPTQGLWVKRYIGDIVTYHVESNESRVYVTSNSGILASLNVETGDLLWRQVMPADEPFDKVFTTPKALVTLNHGVIRQWRLEDGALEWESAQYNSQSSSAFHVKADMTRIAKAGKTKSKSYDILTIDSNDVLTLYGHDSSISWKSISLLSNFPDHKDVPQFQQMFRESRSHRLVVESSTENTEEQTAYNVYIATWNAHAIVVSHVVIDAFSQMRFVKQSNIYQAECNNTQINTAFWLPNNNKKELVLVYDCKGSLYGARVNKETVEINSVRLAFDSTYSNIKEWDIPYFNNKRVIRINGNLIYTISIPDSLNQIDFQRVHKFSDKVQVCANSKYVVNLSQGKIHDMDEKKSTEYTINQIQDFIQSHGTIKRCWGHKQGIVLVTEDLALSFIHLQSNTNTAQLKWTREESLGLPISTHMFDQTKEDVVCKNETECEGYYHTSFPSFAKRTMNDLKMLQQRLLSPQSLWAIPKYIGSTLRMLLIRVVGKVPLLQTLLPPDFLLGEELVFSSIAFEKVITLYSQSHKLFGIESETGHILWSVYLPGLLNSAGHSKFRMIDVVKVREHPPHLLIILSSSEEEKSWLVSVGSPFHSNKPSVHFEQVPFQVRAAVLTSWILTESGDKIVLLVDKNQKAHVFPEHKEAHSIIRDNHGIIYFHLLDKAKDTLMGYGLMINHLDKNELLCNLIWSKSFRNTQERIVDIATQPHGQQVVNAIYRTGNKGALYKYLNPHLIAVATLSVDRIHGTPEGNRRRSSIYQSDSRTNSKASKRDRKNTHDNDDDEDIEIQSNKALHIYLIDSITGRVYTHHYHANTAEPVSLLLFENKLIYSFWNAKTQLSEILVMDMWLNDPNDLTTDSHGYVVPPNPLGDSNTFSSFNAPLPIITTQAYNYQYGIEKIAAVTNTKYSITNKWILLKLTSGSIIAMDSHFLNSRRPITDELKEEHQEERIMPYRQYLPFNTLTVVSHGHILTRVKSIISVGSAMESTSLIFGNGLDMFYRHLTPSGAFDRINDDFDFLVLFGMLVGIVIAISVAKYFSQRHQISKDWE